MASGRKGSPSLSEMHLPTCPRSSVTWQKSHHCAKQQLLAGVETMSGGGLELAQLCIQPCCCSASPQANAATPQLTAATQLPSGPRELEERGIAARQAPASTNLAPVCAMHAETLSNAAPRQGRVRKRHPCPTTLPMPSPRRDNAPASNPHSRTASLDHTHLLLTRVKPQRGEAIGEQPPPPATGNAL